MPVLPANFFHRQELQHLLLRASRLRAETENEHIAAGLSKLLAGAAALDGFLADVPVTPHAVYKALDNPNGWTSEWLDSRFEDRTLGGELVVIVLGHQVLRTPVGEVIGTGRYRLTTGDGDTTETCDRDRLHKTLVAYVTAIPDLDPTVQDFFLTKVFAGDGEA